MMMMISVIFVTAVNAVPVNTYGMHVAIIVTVTTISYMSAMSIIISYLIFQQIVLGVAVKVSFSSCLHYCVIIISLQYSYALLVTTYVATYEHSYKISYMYSEIM